MSKVNFIFFVISTKSHKVYDKSIILKIHEYLAISIHGWLDKDNGLYD